MLKLQKYRITKYKNIFAKGYTPNWSEEVFVVSEIKNTVPWTFAISEKKLLEVFTKKNCQEKFRIEEVNKSKDYKFYFKCKGYNNSFNSWIDKKD